MHFQSAMAYYPYGCLKVQKVMVQKALTFSDDVLDVLVKAEPVAFAPQAHVGGVVLAAALVRGAHGEQLPPIARHQELSFPAIEPGAAGAQGQAVIGDVDESRVLATAREVSAALPVASGVRLVPVIRADSHGQHAQRAQGQRETGVEQQLPGRHALPTRLALSTTDSSGSTLALPAHKPRFLCSPEIRYLSLGAMEFVQDGKIPTVVWF